MHNTQQGEAGWRLNKKDRREKIQGIEIDLNNLLARLQTLDTDLNEKGKVKIMDTYSVNTLLIMICGHVMNQLLAWVPSSWD
jgi:hypothetical protein